jgi:hypothetical protein
MEELSVAAAGRAEISYESVSTDLTGSVTLHDVALLPTGSPAPLHIASVRFGGPPPTFFLLGPKSGEPPAKVALDIQGIRVDLDPALFDSLQREAGAAGGDEGCGPGRELDPALLRELGFQEVLVNASAAYEYDQARQRLEGRMDLEVEQIEQMQASIGLDDVAPDSLQGSVTSIPSLAALSTTLRVQPKFGKAYVAACAKRLGLTADAYREKMLSASLAQMSRGGLQLGAGLRQALADFQRDWGEISFTARPPQPLNLMSLMFRPPADWREALGLRVQLNQRDVADLQFDLRPPNANELAQLMGQEPPPAAPRVIRPRYHRVFRQVGVDILKKYVGDEVRLHLRGNQPTRSGILMGVSDNEARVEQRLLGGKITAHVQLQDIEKAEVEKLEKQPQPPAR